METALETRCRALLMELGLCEATTPIRVKPLTGGVASDIARVNCGSTSYCVKFALPRLKVEADWRAPVHRNRAEYAWLEVAAAVAPECALQLHGRSQSEHGFVMEYLAGNSVTLWKSELLAGEVNSGRASAVGDVLGRIHAASTSKSFNASAFQNRDDFEALRIEPYLYFTAKKHPDLADRLRAMGAELYQARQVLVHGDVSPKNILFRDDRPILLDAECATMGDPAFDVGFCLNHLVLKAMHLPQRADALMNEARALWKAYAQHVSWENRDMLEIRVAALLPALMLARVDGKSPVEYLSEPTQDHVRRVATAFIVKPRETLSALFDHLQSQAKEVQA